MAENDRPGDPALSEFIELRDGRVRMLVRRGYERWASLLGPASGPAAIAGVPGGRAEHPLIELPGDERVLVRRYHRGGAVRHVNRSRYFAGRRSFDELRVTEHARAAGVRVPIVLAASEHRHVLGYSAWLASRWIPGARDLAAWLGDRGSTAVARERVMEALGRQAGMMHAAGIGHPDLNLRNVLVAADGDDLPAVHLIDFDRGRIYPGPVPERRRRAEIERFGRSARKLGERLAPREWVAFRGGYGTSFPAGARL